MTISAPAPYPDISYSIRLFENSPSLRFRCRLLRQIEGDLLDDFWVYFDWLDIDGEYLGRDYYEQNIYAQGVLAKLNSQPGIWHDVAVEAIPPLGARYVSWGLVFRASVNGDALVCVGGVHISPFDTDTYPAYRNPRSVILLADYGSDSPPALDVINVAKMTNDAKNRLPLQVSYRALTNLSYEYEHFSVTPTSEVDPSVPAYSSQRVEYDGVIHTLEYDGSIGDAIPGSSVEYSQTDNLPES